MTEKQPVPNKQTRRPYTLPNELPPHYHPPAVAKPANNLDLRLRAQLLRDERAGLKRRLPPVQARVGHHYELDGHAVVGFCSNDYLGFASRRASGTTNQAIGAGASRLVSGEHPIYARVESTLAQLAGQQDAVLFPTGFQLNVGVLPALLARGDLVYSDRLNHASLIDGMRLSSACVTRLDHLSAPPLPKHESDDPARWWICESLYSMDGDGPAIADLAHHLEHGGLLYADEAHAFGLYRGGRSRLAEAKLQPTAQVLTFGKALGVAGAALAASRTVCQWIRTHARSFVFSTGPSPQQVELIEQALTHLRSEAGDAAREKLWRNHKLFAQSLDIRTPQAPIFPLLIADPNEALSLSHALLQDGFHVQAIRPPTVPIGGSRLRVTISATHSTDEITRLASALRTRLPTIRLAPSPARLAKEPLP